MPGMKVSYDALADPYKLNLQGALFISSSLPRFTLIRSQLTGSEPGLRIGLSALSQDKSA